VEGPPAAEELPAAEEPRVEEPPAAAEPQAEEPPAAEEPRVEEPPAAEEPQAEELPAAEEPRGDEPPAAAAEPRREWAAAEEPAGEEAPPARAPRPEEQLYAALGAHLRTPPVVSAGIIGAGALGICFAVALVLAALPDRSLIGFLGSDATYLEETFRQMCQLVLAGFENDALFDVFRQTDRVAPLIFALVPIAATFLLARNQRPRLHTLPFWTRLAWAASGAWCSRC
jgi:hypothetical protein